MLDYYIYASDVPSVNPDVYADPSELVKDIRFNDLDPFSSVQDTAERTRFFEDGVSFGLGYNWRFDDNDDVRIRFAYDDSPFGRAGIKRGDIAVSVNGESLSDISDERLQELIGSQENPVNSIWTFIDGETGSTKAVSVTPSEYRLNTVLDAKSYISQNFNGVVGHIVFNQFVETSVDELDTAIQRFIDDGVTELVLDLRYNGGGRSHVGARLASQIAGSIVHDQLKIRDLHNEKYSRFDYERYFPEALPALDINRVVVLTTGSTASASERLISSLRPYFEVVTIGSTTRGKAFSSNDRKYCGKTLSAMRTRGVNANGVSVAGGISADCYAKDDLTNNFGPGEGMLQSALNYLVDGSCQAAPTTIAARSGHKRSAPKTAEIKMFESMNE